MITLFGQHRLYKYCMNNHTHNTNYCTRRLHKKQMSYSPRTITWVAIFITVFFIIALIVSLLVSLLVPIERRSATSPNREPASHWM